MPRYIYKCEECGIIFQVAHSIKEKLLDCEECNEPNTLQRIPSMPLVLTKKQAGGVVKEYIENAKEDMKNEKRELSTRTYEDD